jgi:hypothetical protein
MARRKLNKMAHDAGNGTIKTVSEFGESAWPHAIRRVSAAELQEFEQRGRLATDRKLWQVNGEYYYIGERAMKAGAGAVLYGENRYKADYYGVIAAISAYHVFPESANNIFLYGGHTPKDTIYRPNLIEAVKSVPVWTVTHNGDTRKYSFVDAKGYEETVGVYRYATMSEDGLKAVAGWLRPGNCLVLDFGAYTIGTSVAENGKIDYSASDSEPFGVLNVLDELGQLIRRNNKDALRGVQKLEQMKLRAAFANPLVGYDAGGLGFIPCQKEVDQAVSMFMRELDVLFQKYGGITAYHNIILGGGGAAAMESEIRKTLGHKKITMADENRAVIHMAGVRGAAKILNRLEAAGKLDGDID